MPSQTETRRIVVELQSKNDRSLGRIAKGFDGIRRSSQRTASVLERFDRTFSRLFNFTLAGVGVSSIIGVADGLQLLRDRIRAFEGDSADQTFLQLAEVANFTRTSIENVSESYNRLALATKDLGLNSDALLGLTTALQQSFRLSGASIAEANAATIQLSQGLASGQLRGQELRSVLEQNAVIGEILANTFNTARGNLIRFAESGEITSQVVLRALADNAERLNENAENLGQTFGQTVTVALNRAKVQLDNLNNTLGLNSLFQQGVEALIKNLDVLATTLITVIAAQATSAAINAFNGLTFAIKGTTLAVTLLQTRFAGLAVNAAIAVASINPIVAAVAGLAAVTTFAILNWDRFQNIFAGSFLIIANSVLDGLKSVVDEIKVLVNLLPGVPDAINNALDSASNTLGRTINRNEQLILGFAKKQNDVEDQLNKTSDAQARQIQALKEAANTVTNVGNASSTFAARLAELNQAYDKGSITLESYNRQLRSLQVGRLDEQFNKGQVTLDQYNDRLDKITGGAIPKLNRQLEKGEIDLIEYNDAIRQIDFERVKRGFEQGTVSATEFNAALVKSSGQFSTDGSLFQGINQYIESSGTLASNIADSIEKTFNRLEDSFIDFINTGKFNFRQFTLAILQDLQRIIIRQTIIRGLASGIGSFLGGGAPTGSGGGQIGSGSDGSGLFAAANGAAFGSSGVQFFASGGVVSSPTLFGFGNNRTGVMGEAGPEAILPLRRGSNGDLGVQATPSNVNINIVNNTPDSEVSQTESVDSFGNKNIEILINSTVNQGLAQGQFDRSFKQNFGISRRGL